MDQLQNHLLFQTIQIKDDESFNNFIENLNKDQAWFIILESIRFAQRQGIFSLSESEAISKSIRTFSKIEIITKDDNTG